MSTQFFFIMYGNANLKKHQYFADIVVKIAAATTLTNPTLCVLTQEKCSLWHKEPLSAFVPRVKGTCLAFLVCAAGHLRFHYYSCMFLKKFCILADICYFVNHFFTPASPPEKSALMHPSLREWQQKHHQTSFAACWDYFVLLESRLGHLQQFPMKSHRAPLLCDMF